MQAGLGLCASAGASAAPLLRQPGSARAFSFAPLEAFADTLLPGDEHTPPASALGLHKQLLLSVQGRSARYRLLGAGCGWLDGEARRAAKRSFAALDEAARLRIVERAERSPPASLARRVFDFTHGYLLREYYAHPRAWRALAYDGPPQPAGFMDYRQAR